YRRLDQSGGRKNIMGGKCTLGEHPFPSCDVPIGIGIVQKSSVPREDRNRKYQYSEEQCGRIGRKDQIVLLRLLKSFLGYVGCVHSCILSLQVLPLATITNGGIRRQRLELAD